MKTLAVTTARQKLGYWLKRALDGEDIGIVMDGEVIGLRPVEVISADYALREYGFDQREAGVAGKGNARGGGGGRPPGVAAKRIAREVREARRHGETRQFTGSADDLACG